MDKREVCVYRSSTSRDAFIFTVVIVVLVGLLIHWILGHGSLGSEVWQVGVYVVVAVAIAVSTLVWGNRVVADNNGVEVRGVLTRKRYPWKTIRRFEAFDFGQRRPQSVLWRSYRCLGFTLAQGTEIRTSVAFRVSDISRLDGIVKELNRRLSGRASGTDR